MSLVPGLNGDLDALLNGLPPDTRAWIISLITGQASITSGAALRALIETLIRAGADPRILLAVLRHLANLRLINPEVVARAIQLYEAEAAAAAESAAGEGAVAAGAGAGMTAIAVLAILAAILAIIMMIWELSHDVTLPGATTPCGDTPAARALAQRSFTVTDRSWGARRSLQNAIDAGQAICDTFAAACKGGNCKEGDCKPVISVQTVTQSSGIFWTRTDLTFRCPCYCA